jgi:hypothetical protein
MAAADFPIKSRRLIPDESLMCAPVEDENTIVNKTHAKQSTSYSPLGFLATD